VSDRVVEPFLFLSGNHEIRCYELSSKMNKTFKLARMQDVELLDLVWEHEREHRQMHTDVFMFSGEQVYQVTLVMGRLATSVLREEHPKAERYIEPQDDGHWRVVLPVCSMIGVGRFVMGLFTDIEVLGCDEFKDYLRQQIVKLNNKQL
jgi:predicted DNA-binding transcriptional regulator YafY